MTEVSKHEPGSFSWAELATSDTAAAKKFYTSLFGWSFPRLDEGDGPGYWGVGNPAAANGTNGGVRQLTGGDQPVAAPIWLPYFTVESVATATDTVMATGGGVRTGPVQIGAGTVAVVSDPAGAVFGLYEGEVDD